MVELRTIRKAAGFTQRQMADMLGKSLSSYKKKEAGEVHFQDDEKMAVIRALGMNMRQVNDVWFDGEIPE
ncbi:MAG: helix-turn-helix transcriptional regulator [Lachnospiraceae bacterium]|nr:helix-turn-helix transcriptional regulator [Lachnospiraceae bacterium]